MPSELVNFATLCPITHSIPAFLAPSSNLLVIIPSNRRYLMPDWEDNLLTTSLIGTLKISFWSPSNATASKVSLRFGKILDATSAIDLSSSLFNAGAGLPFLISSTIGCRISSNLWGVNSSTSTPVSACNS